MIDKTAFVREIALLAARFERQLSEPVMARYYELLSRSLTTEQFESAAMRAFAESTWFPSPQQLIDYALGTIEDAAELEWLELMAATRDDRRAALTDAGRSALAAIGGSWALQNEPTDRLRQAWMRSYAAIGRAHRAALTGRALPDEVVL